MHSSRLLIGLVLASQCLAPGCKTFNKAKFNHGDGINGDSVLVIPFSEPRQSLWYGESENGRAVAEAFKAWVRRNADPDFPEGEEADQILRMVMNWQDKKITASQWKQLTAGIGVKYVLCGEIESVSLTRPGRIGLLDPTATVGYRLVNVQTGKLAFEAQADVFEYGAGHETDIPVVELGADQALARRKLLAKLGEKIAKDLYGYYPERG